LALSVGKPTAVFITTGGFSRGSPRLRNCAEEKTPPGPPRNAVDTVIPAGLYRAAGEPSPNWKLPDGTERIDQIAALEGLKGAAEAAQAALTVDLYDKQRAARSGPRQPTGRDLAIRRRTGRPRAAGVRTHRTRGQTGGRPARSAGDRVWSATEKSAARTTVRHLFTGLLRELITVRDQTCRTPYCAPHPARVPHRAARGRQSPPTTTPRDSARTATTAKNTPTGAAGERPATGIVTWSTPSPLRSRVPQRAATGTGSTTLARGILALQGHRPHLAEPSSPVRGLSFAAFGPSQDADSRAGKNRVLSIPHWINGIGCKPWPGSDISFEVLDRYKLQLRKYNDEIPITDKGQT